jgi:hypothetical protein
MGAGGERKFDDDHFPSDVWSTFIDMIHRRSM